VWKVVKAEMPMWAISWVDMGMLVPLQVRGSNVCLCKERPERCASLQASHGLNVIA
jgi:hypothetical protein